MTGGELIYPRSLKAVNHAVWVVLFKVLHKMLDLSEKLVYTTCRQSPVCSLWVKVNHDCHSLRGVGRLG